MDREVTECERDRDMKCTLALPAAWTDGQQGDDPGWLKNVFLKC